MRSTSDTKTETTSVSDLPGRGSTFRHRNAVARAALSHDEVQPSSETDNGRLDRPNCRPEKDRFRPALYDCTLCDGQRWQHVADVPGPLVRVGARRAD